MRGITNIVIMTGSPFERKDLEWACYRLFPDADRECFLDVQSGLDYMLIRQGKDVKEHARRWLVLADVAMPVIPDLGQDDKAGEYVLKQMRKYLGGTQARHPIRRPAWRKNYRFADTVSVHPQPAPAEVTGAAKAAHSFCQRMIRHLKRTPF